MTSMKGVMVHLGPREIARDARVSRFEQHALVTGMLMILAGLVLAILNGTAGGPAWLLGTTGLGVLGLCAISRGLRLYRAGVIAALPESVGRVGIRTRPRRLHTAATALSALVLPAALTVAFVALVDWAWLAIGAGLLLATPPMIMAAQRRRREEELRYVRDSPGTAALLSRLCMRADIATPELVVEPSPEANAWTTRGRIHVTTQLLNVLDRSELEAVLAHEVAHLAHRDAAVMDVCSAPSRVLLSFAGVLISGLRAFTRHLFDLRPLWGLASWGAAAGVVSVPPALLLGFTSRLSVLGMSRSREYAADAAAAALTGRPTALASALMKLDSERDWLPRADLRQAEARAVLCIVGVDRSGPARLLRTHPPVAARVRRLEELELRLNGR